MPSIRRGILAGVVALGLAIPGGSALGTEDESSRRDHAEEMAREAMEQLMHALELFIESIPQYEMPEVNEHGDIIIRRKRLPRREEKEGPVDPEMDSTRT